MWVEKEFKFEAAHILPRHQGKCSRLHGHSWRVVLAIEGDVNDYTGFVMDFYDLGEIMDPIIDRFDHRLLNCFVQYPSSENIALHIAHLIRGRLASYHYQVRVSETQKTWAVFDSKRDLHMIEYGPLDAEWRSPDINVPTGTYMEDALAQVSSSTKAAQDNYIELLTRFEQLMLYKDSCKKVTS